MYVTFKYVLQLNTASMPVVMVDVADVVTVEVMLVVAVVVADVVADVVSLVVAVEVGLVEMQDPQRTGQLSERETFFPAAVSNTSVQSMLSDK